MKPEFLKTILLVEDEPIIALDTSHRISRLGYKVVMAFNSESAIKLIKKNQDISLVLMDINLGEGINGAETAKTILKINNIPVIFLSSYSEDEYLEIIKNVISYGYLLKNSSDAVLSAAITFAYSIFEPGKTKEMVELEILSHKTDN